MDFHQLDFQNPKTLLLAGGVAGVALIALMHKASAPANAPQTVTVQPANGASWSDVIPPNNGGVIGSIGPGDPVPGDSAYQVWLKAGNVGTQQDFLNSLKGAKGDPGSPGKPGTPGTNTTTTKDPWVKVSYQGRTGYAHMAYLCGNKVCNTGGDGLRLRSSGSYTASVITVMPEGATVSRLAAGEEVIAHNPNPGGNVSGFYPLPHAFKGGKVKVSHGDSYFTLSRKVYGHAMYWNRLASLNGNQTLRVGDSLDY